MQINESSDHISVEGHIGTWYVIDSEKINDENYYLVESEQYGDEAACLILNEKGALVMDEVSNGFDDFKENYIDVMLESMTEQEKEAFIQGTELSLDMSDEGISDTQIKLYNALISERTDKKTEQSINVHEAEYGADGNRAFGSDEPDAPNELDMSIDKIDDTLMRLSEGENKVLNINGNEFTITATFDEELDGNKYYKYTITAANGNTHDDLTFIDASKYLCSELMTDAKKLFTIADLAVGQVFIDNYINKNETKNAKAALDDELLYGDSSDKVEDAISKLNDTLTTCTQTQIYDIVTRNGTVLLDTDEGFVEAESFIDAINRGVVSLVNSQEQELLQGVIMNDNKYISKYKSDLAIGTVQYNIFTLDRYDKDDNPINPEFVIDIMTYEGDGDWDDGITVFRSYDRVIINNINDLLNSGKLLVSDIDNYINANYPASQRLFVDMDGTLAVFSTVSQIETLYEKGYFANLSPQENVVNAVKNIIKTHPEIEVNILSAYLSDSAFAIDEKNAWLDKYLPEIGMENRVFMPCGSDKKEYVEGLQKTDFLLDDYTANLKAWEPPARGIKLLTDINYRHGSWTSDRIRFDKPPGEIAENIITVMHGRARVLDASPARRAEKDNLHDLISELSNVKGVDKDVVKEAYKQGSFLNGYIDNSLDFRLYGSDDVSSVAVFSDPINALSHASIDRLMLYDFKTIDRIAPGGDMFSSLEQYLDDNPNIRRITLCTNNDKAGDKEAERLKSLLFKAGYTAENGYHCERQIPTGHKDFNGYLLSYRNEQNGQRHEPAQSNETDCAPEEGDDY